MLLLDIFLKKRERLKYQQRAKGKFRQRRSRKRKERPGYRLREQQRGGE